MKKCLIVCLISLMLISTACGNNRDSRRVNQTTSNSSYLQENTSQEVTMSSESTTVAFEEDIEFAGFKADDYYLSEVIASFEERLVYAINDNEFSYIESFLIPESSLYNYQKKNILELFKSSIKIELIQSSIVDIQQMGSDEIYRILVDQEKVIKYPDKQELETVQSKLIYTVVEFNDTLRIKEIEVWKK